MDPVQLRVRTPGPRAAMVRELGPAVLAGCCREAERADIVSMSLEGLRDTLPESLKPHLSTLIGQIRATSYLLRDLADRSQVHLTRVPVVTYAMEDDVPRNGRRATRDYVARTVLNVQSVSGIAESLAGPVRHTYRSQSQAVWLTASRHADFDINAMEMLRVRILKLREARQIDPPSPIRTDLVRKDTALDFWRRETDIHWAEAIFTQPLPYRRDFKKRSRCDIFGALHPMGHLRIDNVKILVKRSFEHDRISIIMLLRLADHVPLILVRIGTPSGEPWVSMHAIHELHIRRDTTSSLQLCVWNHHEHRDMPVSTWANLSFMTWEELVLFYCTFMSLKVYNDPVHIDPRELTIGKEKRLFSAHIDDDGYDHQLMVMQDTATQGLRLHTVRREQAFRKCPVWTAFVPPNRPEDWLIPRNRYRLQLRDLQVYSFDQNYHPHHRRRSEYGDYEIQFKRNSATIEFTNIFCPPPEP
ncbi:hypothetical protein GGR57DRAFT_508640 [Xylariaceae sp. FL1272]|nr:hypothetical protein GGR57DRAFT_508640 [Xylariaceae sp. FL1272]